ncbi:MAG: hypothetical protein PVF22_00900 [Candidatus Aminicenantes bacterium]|jgi:hypothetical protein
MRIKYNSSHFLKFFVFFLFVTLLFNAGYLYPCTAAIVSGKVTPDGRPLLWKNRDTSDPNNKVVFLTGDKYSFIAVVNAGDRKAVHVWQGINNQGFAIMNTASGDLARGDQNQGGENGIFMKRALGVCADVKDFEMLLQETNGHRQVAANYGVIDAKGSACFFETGNTSFVKYDANDPKTAPQGFIVRTNYAFSAPVKNQGGGYIRYDRAQNLFENAAARKELTCRFILQVAARDLINEKLHSDPFSARHHSDYARPLYINTNDTINRNSTMSVSVFHGAPGPDQAHLATMWVLLGQPVASVAVPLWAHAEGVPEELTGERRAPICDLARKIVAYLYDDVRGHMEQYMNATKLLKSDRKGILSVLYEIENTVLAETQQRQEEWAKNKPDRLEILEFEKRMATRVYESILNFFSGLE